MSRIETEGVERGRLVIACIPSLARWVGLFVSFWVTPLENEDELFM